MASETIFVRHSLCVEDLADLVRLVAIDASRQCVFLFLPELSSDDFPMHNLDLAVTLRTCCGDIAACN